MKDYFSQRFRNLRRYSEQTEQTSSPTSNKIVTKENAIAVAKLPRETGCLDKVGYSRSMEGLIREVKKPQPRQEVIKKLLELTFEGRRQKINGALVQRTTLLDEYPFF